MNFHLTDRVAIVTGASQGIGKGIAGVLAREGARVALVSRRAKILKEVQKEILAAGGHAEVFPADLIDARASASIVKQILKRYGRLDILVNNAGGVDRFADFPDIKENEWLQSYRLNLLAPVHMVQASLPWLKKSAAPRIINISSISGIQPGFYNAHYTTTKAAVINLSKYLANRLAKDRILVNVVCPGPVRTEAWEKNFKMASKTRHLSYAQAVRFVESEETQKIPLGRIGLVQDVTGLVAFLASDHASWITGSCFHINGGKLRTM
jgi:3-oxoacyl-[acyl-carrier protein] reductase